MRTRSATPTRDLAKLIEPVPVQRVHGDYHLGQVMRTQTGWIVLDFEGEPGQPAGPAARPVVPAAGRGRHAPLVRLRGPAPARHPPGRRPASRPGPPDWVRRNGDAFCAGYAAAGGLDPAENSVLLRAMLLDKAVYEVIYEARNRPTWLPIPLESIAEL